MLTQTLQKITRLLKDYSVPYMVIGGYATLYELDLQNVESILQEFSNLLGNDEIMKNWKDILQI